MPELQQLPIQLPVHGCKVAGTQLKTALAVLDTPTAPLDDALREATAPVLAATSSLSALLPDDVKMTDVDRGTDHSVASFRDLLVAIVGTLEDSPALALKDNALPRRKNAAALLAALFPEGTRYLTRPYLVQWSHLDSLKTAIQKPENQALLASLKLEAEAERLADWIDLYGAKLEVTSSNPSFQEALTRAWAGCLEAWDELYLEVRHYLKRHRDNAQKTAIAEKLLAPYEEQAKLEQEAARRYRQALAERKEAKKAEK
jgi:hypothetical protein